MPLQLSDLDPEMITKLGLGKEAAKPREYKFTKDQVRTNALNVMSVVSKLSQSERRRVLEHCLKLNDVQDQELRLLFRLTLTDC